MAGLVLGARPADVLELTIRLQVQHLEPALARHVLGTMCEVARGTRFRRWLDRALGAAAGGAGGGARGAGGTGRAGGTGGTGGAAAAVPAPRAPARVAAPCCGRPVCCRRCHDARPGACDRALDARAVTEMACRACGARGPVGRRSPSARRRRRVLLRPLPAPRRLRRAHVPLPLLRRVPARHGLGVDFHHRMRRAVRRHHAARDTACTGAAGRACGACGGDLAATPDRVVVLGCGHPAHAVRRGAAGPLPRLRARGSNGLSTRRGPSSPGVGAVRVGPARRGRRLRAGGKVAGAVTVPA